MRDGALRGALRCARCVAVGDRASRLALHWRGVGPSFHAPAELGTQLCHPPPPPPPLLQAQLSWQDPSATLGVCILLSVVAALVFFLGLSTVLAFALCFVIRPPALRTPTPPLPAVVFGKLPTRNDVTA